MKRSEVLAWLQAGGGQKGQAVIEYEDVPNPVPSSDPAKKTIKVKKVTWTRNDDETLVVYDKGEMASDDSTPETVDTEPTYEVIGGGPKKQAVDSRTPERKEDDEREIKEKRNNFEATGRWETNAMRESRERAERQEGRQTDIDERNTTNDEANRKAKQRELDLQEARDKAAEKARVEAATNDATRIGIEQSRYELERDKANRPNVLGTPKDTDKSVAIFNPVDGTITAQDNPLYDAKKVEAEEKKQQLLLAIQTGKMSQDEATAEYKMWYDKNVELPFKLAAERRAEIAAKQQARDALDRREQFQVTSDQRRQEIGQQAGHAAAQEEIALLPYRAGPKFGSQMAGAINSLAKGGSLSNNASAGVKFTDDAFEFKRPDLKEISKRATKAALKGLSKYDPDKHGDDPVPDYQGVPDIDISTAPALPALPDYNSMYQQIYGTLPYTPAT